MFIIRSWGIEFKRPGNYPEKVKKIEKYRKIKSLCFRRGILISLIQVPTGRSLF